MFDENYSDIVVNEFDTDESTSIFNRSITKELFNLSEMVISFLTLSNDVSDEIPYDSRDPELKRILLKELKELVNMQ